MTYIRRSQLILAVLLVTSTVSSFYLDWKPNHLLHPGWHPHARFHGGLLLFFLAGVCATGLWLLFRKSKEPLVAIDCAGLLLAAYWSPLLYAAYLVPGSSGWAGPPDHRPAILPNGIVAAIFLAAVFAACRMARTESVSSGRAPNAQRRG